MKNNEKKRKEKILTLFLFNTHLTLEGPEQKKNRKLFSSKKKIRLARFKILVKKEKKRKQTKTSIILPKENLKQNETNVRHDASVELDFLFLQETPLQITILGNKKKNQKRTNTK